VSRPLALAVTTLALAAACATMGTTPGAVHFASLDGAALDGYLFRPAGAGPHPAVVFLHGCGGLISSRGGIQTREADWAPRLTALGYVVFMVDSFTPRGVRRMCSPATFSDSIYRARPRDAYGALRYLQAQESVRPDRVALMGWSQGGGVVLLSIRAASLGRPASLPTPDFRAAVAFYPASCRERAHRTPWTSAIPLLILVGAEDNWTPAAPCRELAEGAVRRGAHVEMRVYPGAYHDFDWPGRRVQSHPAFTTSAGVVPVTGTDPAARDDALQRVPAFLGRYLRD
jgi:dienelactone hydrolase